MNENKTQGFLPVVAALAGNVFIMVIKWIGFFATGSGALFSEAVHSVADVLNQLLLMIGTRIDDVEKKIKDAVPEVRHIDIEVN